MRLWSGYVQNLETNPILTKSLTSGVLNVMGDFIQQMFFSNNSRYDYGRTARQAIWGAAIPGPFLHYFYGGLARRFPGNSAKTVLTKIALDQTVGAPLIVTSFYWTTGLLEGKSVSDVKKKYVESFWPTMKLNYQLWPAAQAVNFAFVPVAWQVIYVASVSLVWNVILSGKNASSNR
jgi:hypothetical protein